MDAPAEPTGLKAKVGGQNVLLTWNLPEDTTITSWQYEQNNVWHTLCTTSGDAACPATRRYVVSGLSASTNYSFKVRAVNPLGNGVVSAAVSATTGTTPSNLVTNGAAGPVDLIAARNDGGDEATVSWTYAQDPNDNLKVPQYEMQYQRLIVTTGVGGVSTTFWADDTFLKFPGVAAGSNGDSYVVTGLDPSETYRFRIRVIDGSKVTLWSAYVVNGGAETLRIEAPGSFSAALGPNAESVVLSWNSPPVEVDDYALQREQIVSVEGSGLPVNRLTLGNPWVASSPYTDSSVSPGAVYRYRVAGVLGGRVGRYSEWVSILVALPDTFGSAPENLRIDQGTDSGDDGYPDRREFALTWDAVDGADSYEVETLTHIPESNGAAYRTRIVTDNWSRYIIRSRTDFRVRGRRLDPAVCGQTRQYCYTEWSIRLTEDFIAKWTGSQAAPIATPSPEVRELRRDTEGVITAMLSPLGFEFDPADIVNFLVMLGLTVVVLACIFGGQKKGTAPLGAAIGAGLAVLIMAVAVRLLGIPPEWVVAMVIWIMLLGALGAGAYMRLGKA